MLSRNNLIGVFLAVLLVLPMNDYVSAAAGENIPTKFKSCKERGPCHRNVHYSTAISSLTEENSIFEPVYSIDSESLAFGDAHHVLSGVITKKFVSVANVKKFKEFGKDNINMHSKDVTTMEYPFHLDFSEFDENIMRFTVNEERKIESKPTLPEHLELSRFNSTPKFAFLNQDYFQKVDAADYHIHVHEAAKGFEKHGGQAKFSTQETNYIEITYKENLKIEINMDYFQIHVYYKDVQVLGINDNNFLNMEQLRKISEIKQKTSPLESTFQSFHAGGYKVPGDMFDDSLPFGPESVALDFTFLANITDVYGIPENARNLRLIETTDIEPYRLFNADSFMYEPHTTAPLYGSIPFMFGMTPKVAAGVFWINAAGTDINIKYSEDKTLSHWISEAGILDFVVFVGDKPSDIVKSFTKITGTLSLPPLSALGYHQCRWNYNSQEDALNVDAQMEKNGIPYDFIWLDIEYTDSKKYFTWDNATFPDPEGLLRKLGKKGRQLLTIIDPHIKVNYFASDLMLENNCTVKDNYFKPFKGKCWPGESYWIDTFDPTGVKTWTDLYKGFLGKDFKNLHFWNDMNEPSVFEGPELSFPLDNIHYGGVEHRSVHNLYGMSVHEATYSALKDIKTNQRPFVLTRSFFAGSQKTAGTWTGDNQASWDHLEASLPMLLSLNVAGMPFVGADVGGFFGHPTNELMVRWNQAGAFYPFFRSHANIDAPRREPYLFPSPYKEYITDAIQLRYQLLPTIYNEFRKASIDGSPIFTPMFYKYPELEDLYNVDNQFYLGGLLVKPITHEGLETTVIFPSKDNIFYKYDTFEIYEGGVTATVDAPLDSIPMFIEGGNIIFTKSRLRRSTETMKHDPYTLTIAPDLEGSSKGSLYVDDGISFDFENHQDYLSLEITLSGNTLSSNVTNPNDKFGEEIERIVIPNVSFSKATLKSSGSNEETALSVTTNTRSIIIENPKIPINKEWTITLA